MFFGLIFIVCINIGFFFRTAACYFHSLFSFSLLTCTKSCQGYTIPLDKRLAADGRGLQTVHINENFAKLAEALYIADRKVIHCAYVVQIFFPLLEYTPSQIHILSSNVELFLRQEKLWR